MNLKFLASLEVMVNSVRYNVILAIDLAMIGKFIGNFKLVPTSFMSFHVKRLGVEP